ncbi:CPBP family intramembrane glutamic endopeptidase [Reichenbachiella versicolor]|uniref:CPBP family intramembrane glutamic endopeptidase n=1 Tax=Reichenbachiella versicolor TaxID=1821036 RepID=UPI000D6DF053|nr:CPBP family intramembrane glutamic endopeptidase [Reichenbachiella versicolor]
MSDHVSKSPLLLLIVLTLISLGVYLIVPNVYLLIGALITGVDLSSLMTAMQQEGPQPLYQNLFLVVQALAAGTSFILVPFLFVKYYEKEDFSEIISYEGENFVNIILIAAMTIVFMIVNSPFIEWNMNVQFPEGLHEKLRLMEDMAEKATKFLTHFYSLPYFLASVIVIAIIPALGEELLFRGMIQRYWMKIFSNPHVAIWVTALAFSAFHLQFFGFLPRMLLGALFGYVYFYSGNLWYAVAAHFTNNAFTILMLYLYQQGITEIDIESTDSIPWSTVLVFTLIGVFLFGFFVKRVQKR